MSSSEQDSPLQCSQDTEGKGWQEAVPEVLTLMTQFARTHHMNSACCGVRVVCHCKSMVNVAANLV